MNLLVTKHKNNQRWKGFRLAHIMGSLDRTICGVIPDETKHELNVKLPPFTTVCLKCTNHSPTLARRIYELE